MTTRSRPLFLDANILAYAVRSDAPEHGAALALLGRAGEAGDELWVSRQVLRELTRALLKPNASGARLTSIVVAEIVTDLSQRYLIAEDNELITQKFLELKASLSLPASLVHDANIVATMLALGIRRIATHNASDFERFGGLIEIVGLRH